MRFMDELLGYMIFYAITLCFIMFICPFVGPLIWTNKVLSYLILFGVEGVSQCYFYCGFLLLCVKVSEFIP